MHHFLDETARILASPLSRREAVRRIGVAALAGIVGTLWAGDARAQACSPACKKDESCCGGKECCKKNQTCCTTCSNKAPFCVTPKKKCPATTAKC